MNDQEKQQLGEDAFCPICFDRYGSMSFCYCEDDNLDYVIK